MGDTNDAAADAAVVTEADTEVPTAEIYRSSRDEEHLRASIERWLARQLPAGSEPEVSPLEGTSTNGMSSDTVLFDASWLVDGVRHHESLVARIAPDDADVPVFREYDLGRQFEAIRVVAEHSDVPVPHLWWLEVDTDVLGSPFFVMRRVEGRVPPDVMPYTFGDNWLYDASPDEQRLLQDRTVDIIADLHAIPEATTRFSFLEYEQPGATPLRRHVAHVQAWYDFAVADGLRSPLVEQGFAWLDEHWPTVESDTVLCWGDARIGNILYQGFEPAAVLDWEMAALGPRELDLAWLVFAHMVFEDITAVFELPGMPHFLQPVDVLSRYQARTGHAARDFEFYLTLCAVQWGVVFLRTGLRQAHFGEIEMPDDPEELLRHRFVFERLLGGETVV